jgi:hypothetical protein
MKDGREKMEDRNQRLTAEDTEYAENRLSPSSPSVYSAYSAVLR